MNKIKEFFKERRKSIDISAKENEISGLEAELPKMLTAYNKIENNRVYVFPFKGSYLYLPGHYLKDVMAYSEGTLKDIIRDQKTILENMKNNTENNIEI